MLDFSVDILTYPQKPDNESNSKQASSVKSSEYEQQLMVLLPGYILQVQHF